MIRKDSMNFLRRWFGRKPPRACHETASKAMASDHQMTSLVLLMAAAPTLTQASLLETLDRLYPGAFLPPKEQGNFVVDGPVKGATFMIQCTVPQHEGMFMLHTVPAPYSGYSPFMQYIQDPGLAKHVEAHRAWLSVDAVLLHETQAEAYRFIGNLLVALAPEDTIALVHPSLLRTLPFTEEVRSRLASDGQVFAADA